MIGGRAHESGAGKELEKEISKALQGLPDLAAPPGFLTRTMTALEQPAPWYAVRAWTKWPVPVRIAFSVHALAAVAAAVVGWARLSRVFGCGHPGLAPAARA
jgi:hypothetical protein